jgi:hypothetical protein
MRPSRQLDLRHADAPDQLWLYFYQFFSSDVNSK